MSIKVAVMGFSHGHIHEAINKIRNSKEAEIVAICEENAEIRKGLTSQTWECPIFDSFAKLLSEVECDVIAIGDYYGNRGSVCITSLKHGKHVLSDKPICTRLEEFDQVKALAEERKLSVSCQLSLRESPVFRKIRSLVKSGAIGEVHAISTNGQHPLLYGKRPGWYFEEGKHGGTINDILIHAIDFIPWVTGHPFSTVNAARNWNAAIKEEPHFLDAAQVMFTLKNGCGVLADGSYLSPDGMGYTFPWYWKTVFWGSQGVIEGSIASPTVTLYQKDKSEAQILEGEKAGADENYLAALIREIHGESRPDDLTTASTLEASRVALIAQKAADDHATNIRLDA